MILAKWHLSPLFLQKMALPRFFKQNEAKNENTFKIFSQFESTVSTFLDKIPKAKNFYVTCVHVFGLFFFSFFAYLPFGIRFPGQNAQILHSFVVPFRSKLWVCLRKKFHLSFIFFLFWILISCFSFILQILKFRIRFQVYNMRKKTLTHSFYMEPFRF